MPKSAMTTPKCPKDGLFMKYAGRDMSIAATMPIGFFLCSRGHTVCLAFPWTVGSDSTGWALP